MPAATTLLLVLAGLMFVVLTIGLVVSVVLLRRHYRRGPEAFTGGERPTGGQALEILRERYARGELSREQFEQMKRDVRP